MSERPPPPWLEEFQGRFSALLRAPLDRSTGTLRADTSAYDPAVDARDAANATARERLAVYHRQYWFRLFGALQTAFPLTTRLLGHWHFNEHVASFLVASPPRGWDLDRAPDGFEAHLAATLDEAGAVSGPPAGRVPRRAVIEAATIDAAYRAVFRAPAVTGYRPSPADAARLLDARLTPSPAVVIVEERWPLMELRSALAGDLAETPAPLPPPLARPQAWAIARRPEGTARVPLEAREAALLTLLRAYPVGEALGRLEAACDPDERATLPARAQGWLARSVQLDAWIGLGLDEDGPQA